MGKETLQTLAEVKMHVRDEHLAHNEMKNRLKRRFGTVDMSGTALAHGHSTPSPRLPPTHSDDMSVSHGSSDPPFNPSRSDMATDPEAEGGTANDPAPPLLSAIVDRFLQQGEMDRAEPDIMDQPAKVSLEDLFNSSRVDWVPHHQRTGKRSLNDEMEVYNLLDADIPGEEGAEVAIDETAGEILTLDS